MKSIFFGLALMSAFVFYPSFSQAQSVENSDDDMIAIGSSTQSNVEESTKKSQVVFEDGETMDVDSPELSQCGEVYFAWGYNRAKFAPSTLHLVDEKSGQYDLTLHDIKAKDRPTDFSVKGYFAPQRIWIPQYVMRLGYMFCKKGSHRWGVEINFSHEKYVMTADQMVRVDGHLNDRQFDGDFVRPDFLKFEHTDGYNLVFADLVHMQDLWVSQDDRFGVYLVNKVGAGPIIPKTDVTLQGVNGVGPGEYYRINNQFHFAGVGVTVENALRIKFLKYGFTEWGVKTNHGWITNSLVTGSGTRATQNITSVELFGTLGVAIPTNKLKFKRRMKHEKKTVSDEN